MEREGNTHCTLSTDRVDTAYGQSMQVLFLPGEKLLWEGQPATGLLWRPIELLLIPFSLFWAGFAFFWNFSVWQSNAPADFQIFGIPFLVAGLYVTVGRFVVDSWIRARTRYAVTNQRVIIGRANKGRVRSMNIRTLPVLELDERNDGSGTVRFESDRGLMSRGAGLSIWSPSMGGPFQFLAIPDARHVYQLVSRQATG